jgi:hypothetical protein
VFLLPTPSFFHNLLATSCPIDSASESSKNTEYFSSKEILTINKNDIVILSEDYSQLVEDETLKNSLNIDSH